MVLLFDVRAYTSMRIYTCTSIAVRRRRCFLSLDSCVLLIGPLLQPIMRLLYSLTARARAHTQILSLCLFSLHHPESPEIFSFSLYDSNDLGCLPVCLSVCLCLSIDLVDFVVNDP